MTGRGSRFHWFAPVAIGAAALLAAVAAAGEADLPRRLWEMAAVVERAYVVAFFDAAKLRSLCL